jgi:PAT family beta-lactamase induction signal transducer AmpG
LASTPVVRPWLFGLIGVPYGAFYGIVAVSLPFLLRQQGLTVGRIASIGAMVQTPTIWYFLWAPIVDIRLRRRTWVVVLALASAMCVAAGLVLIGNGAVRAATAVLVVGSALSQPISSALGGLASAIVPDPMRGRAAGWSQAGMLGGGVLAGAASVWLTQHTSVSIAAGAVSMLIAVPSLAALSIDEPRGPRPELRQHLRAMAHDVITMLRRRDVLFALAFFLSPIGAGALANIFSAVASEYHASPNAVISVAAIGGVMTPLGALLGGIASDRWSRWRVYPLAGFAAAASAALMALAPLTPAAFVIGAAGYALTIGICYAAFMSLAFELVGSGTAASGTRFTLLMAAVNVPVVYMLRLDGFAHTHIGVRGMLVTDAMSNALFGALFMLLLSVVTQPTSPRRRSVSAQL